MINGVESERRGWEVVLSPDHTLPRGREGSGTKTRWEVVWSLKPAIEQELPSLLGCLKSMVV